MKLIMKFNYATHRHTVEANYQLTVALCRGSNLTITTCVFEMQKRVKD